MLGNYIYEPAYSPALSLLAYTKGEKQYKKSSDKLSNVNHASHFQI